MSDTPDEPEEGVPDPGEGAGSGPDDADSPQRGWIDPDDRLWRHPSEVSGPGPAPDVPFLLSAPQRHHYRSAVMVLVGVGAVMAAVAWVIVLLSPASEHPLEGAGQDTAATGSLTTLAGPQNAVPAVADAAGHSLVELQATTSHGTVTMVGVAVAEGGLVATTADLLSGVHRITMVGPGGKSEPASVVATDATSDIALVDVPDDLPVAPFADDTNLDSGTPDLTLSFVPAGGTSVALRCTTGAVTGVGTAIASGPAATMPSITSSPASPALIAGEPLLNAAGAVVGILYDPAPGHRAGHLPAQRPRGRGRRRPPVPGPGGARLAGGAGHGRPGRHRGPGGAGPVGRPGRRPPAGGRADRGGGRHARAHHGGAAGPALRPGPGRQTSALSVQQPSGTKVVDVTLGRSS